MRILVAEDEKELSNALAAILKHEHFAVDTVYDGEAALEYGLTENYDGIVLDIMMPTIDGLTVLAELRRQAVITPVLFLTALGQVEDRIQGLDVGADDYLTKPFAMGELLARIRAMTRRKTEFAPAVLEYGNIALDRSGFELAGPAAAVRLSSKEFQMMEMLLISPGRMVSAEQFLERIWGYDAEAEANVVWVYISYLRRKLQAISADVEIKAARGVGYSLVMRP